MNRFFRRAGALLCAAAAPLSAVAASGVLYTAGFNAWPQAPGIPLNFLSQPQGGVFAGNHLWVGDTVRGFYRLDADPLHVALPDIAAGGFPLLLPKVGQIAWDPLAGAGYVSQPQQPKGNGGGGQGVTRFPFDPVAGSFGFAACPFVVSLAGRRPDAVAIGPDGMAYVGFTSSGDVVRANVALLSGGNCTQLTVQTIGKSAFGGQVVSLAFVGPDLYLAGKDGLGVIRNAAACGGACVAAPVAGTPVKTAVPGLAGDGSHTLYYLRSNQVWRYTPASGLHELFAGGGRLPDGRSAPFAFAAGQSNLLHLDTAGNLWVGDDTSDGKFNGYGRIWFITAGQAPRP